VGLAESLLQTFRETQALHLSHVELLRSELAELGPVNSA
jgi:hypothetical protein